MLLMLTLNVLFSSLLFLSIVFQVIIVDGFEYIVIFRLLRFYLSQKVSSEDLQELNKQYSTLHTEGSYDDIIRTKLNDKVRLFNLI
jgi:hypothetical protein